MPRKIKTVTGFSHSNPEPTNSLFGPQVNPSDMPSLEPKTLGETERFRTKYLSLDDIRDNTENRFAMTSTGFLERSIRKLGQLQPVIVVPVMKEGKPTGKYEIKAGSRRFVAIRNIHQNAESDDEREKFSKIFCMILPEGATEDEIQSVITETNTTSRQLSIGDIFRNFDIIFEREEDGSYRYIPKGKGKYEAASGILKDMGFTFSPASVKDYMAIYTAHCELIREALEAGLMSKRQAVRIARLPDKEQDYVMAQFNAMEEKEFIKWLREYTKESREKKKQAIKGADVLSRVDKARKGIELFSTRNIMFADDLQKAQLAKTITQLRGALDDLEKTMKS